MDQEMQQTPQQIQMNEQAPQKDADVFSVEGARAKMTMPENMRDAYVRIVQAGMALMFSPQTREGAIAALEEPGDMASKLAKAVTAVISMLFKESNGTLPPQLIIPCSVELLLHLVAVTNKGGMGIEKETVADAMAKIVSAVMQQFGVDADVGGSMQNEETEDENSSEENESSEKEEEYTEEDSESEENKPAGIIQGAMR
jgi:hypothetical protein